MVSTNGYSPCSGSLPDARSVFSLGLFFRPHWLETGGNPCRFLSIFIRSPLPGLLLDRSEYYFPGWPPVSLVSRALKTRSFIGKNPDGLWRRQGLDAGPGGGIQGRQLIPFCSKAFHYELTKIPGT
jgi:hypothetical protein